MNLKSKSTLVYPICCIFFCRCIWSNGSQWECYHKMGYCRIEWWNIHGKFMSLKFFLLGICMFVSTFCIATSFNVRSVPFDSHVSGDSPAQISGSEENQKIHIWFAQIPGYFGGPNSNPHKWENYAPVPSICTGTTKITTYQFFPSRISLDRRNCWGGTKHDLGATLFSREKRKKKLKMNWFFLGLWFHMEEGPANWPCKSSKRVLNFLRRGWTKIFKSDNFRARLVQYQARPDSSIYTYILYKFNT